MAALGFLNRIIEGVRIKGGTLVRDWFWGCLSSAGTFSTQNVCFFGKAFVKRLMKINVEGKMAFATNPPSLCYHGKFT